VTGGRLVEEKAKGLLAFTALFSEIGLMNDAANGKVSKWIFLVGDAGLMIFGYFFVLHSPLPISHWEIAAGCVALGAILGMIPFILDYRAMGKALEVNALISVADRIQDLERVTALISSATNEWVHAQTQAEKTSNSAKEIADQMTEEARQFAAVMQKLNDNEKSALRLEVEKLHRAEVEWLQVLVRILDHVFALHAAAERSGQPRVAEQMTQFQNACRDAARRVGLAPFTATPDEPFDAKRHQAVNTESDPPAGAIVAETVGAGFTYQGNLLRPALVRLREANPLPAPPAPPAEAPVPTDPPKQENAGDQLPLPSTE
jgi:molecular chaperone GrpE (heat shock protein)